MLFKKILAGYARVLAAIGRFTLLLALCLGVGVVIVYPLWRLATVSPNLYTVIFTVLIAGIALVFLGAAIIRAWKRDRAALLLSLARKLTLTAGIVGAIVLVFAWQRLAAACVFAAALLVYGFLAFALKKE
jgi:hypothetical protein